MADDDLRAWAEAYWTEHFEPVVKPLIVGALVAAVEPRLRSVAEITEWLKSRPAPLRDWEARGLEEPAPQPTGRAEASAAGTSDAPPPASGPGPSKPARRGARAAAPEAPASPGGQAPDGDAVSARGKRAAQAAERRNLSGASGAAYQAVYAAHPQPVRSMDLLAHLRNLDGGRKGDERDNTFYKAMRRLRGKHLKFQGEFYSLLPEDAG